MNLINAYMLLTHFHEKFHFCMLHVQYFDCFCFMSLLHVIYAALHISFNIVFYI